MDPCAICQNELNEDDWTTRCPNGHSYHFTCMVQTANRAPDKCCPLCRESLPDEINEEYKNKPKSSPLRDLLGSLLLRSIMNEVSSTFGLNINESQKESIDQNFMVKIGM